MPIDLDGKLLQVRNALPPEIKQRVSFIIFQIRQMKGKQLPPSARFMPLRQLSSLFPKMTGEQLAVLTFHILGEAGLLGSTNNCVMDLSTQLQLILQNANSPKDPFEQTFSNLLKAWSDARSGILGNLK